MTFLPFALPDITDAEINEVVHSLKSGWLTTGPKTKQFEKEFCDVVCPGGEAVGVNSATAGLHLALEAISLQPGDQVVTTPYTFTASAEVIRYFGADPVFVDIDFNTFNIDPSKIEAAITSKTKAIIPVHFAGLSCDMDPILSIAKRHNLKVIEDAAHSFPTTYKNKIIGSLESDATVFSFYATKTLATGEGGMLVTKNKDLAKRCRMMRTHGIDRDAFDRYTSKTPAWYYQVVAPGFKYNLTDIASSIGIHQLRRIDEMHQKREILAIRYDESFKDLPFELPPKANAGDQHAYHLYVIRLKRGLKISRDEFIERMSAEGIGCSVHFIPLHIQPYWRDYCKLKPSDFPVALDSYERAVSLPLYSKMSDDDQLRVIKAIKKIVL